MAYLSVQQFYEDMKDRLKLSVLTPAVELNRKIHSAEIHRPGLALSGFYDYFAFDCVQILGKTEIRFLKKLRGKARSENLQKFFSYRIPCVIVTKQQKVPDDFLEMAVRARVPVLRSKFRTGRVASQVTVGIERANAPVTIMHGTLVDIYGVGTLILGESGVGKSECALELVERRHRLVADDVVEIRLENRILIGHSCAALGHRMEIRGLGIIDIESIFGVSAIRNQKGISLAVTLEQWRQDREYERLGLEEKTLEILGAKVPHFLIPIRPGRNIPILVETAALRQRSSWMGKNPAKAFNEQLLRRMGVSARDGDKTS